jgi:hypothetical protein
MATHSFALQTAFASQKYFSRTNKHDAGDQNCRWNQLMHAELMLQINYTSVETFCRLGMPE